MHALYKKEDNWNCYLRPNEAIQLAIGILQKAQLILEENLDDAAVQLWSKGKSNETLYCGLTIARKGPRRKSPGKLE
jgi:hypothetical protein